MDNNPAPTNPKQQIVDRLKQANNILVTVSSDPSVDQLAACIGLTLLLNKLGKHGTAVFSGEVPSTIEFLEPEKTIEKTTDSLRDFIIALDKSKADKLRYKVEENVVKIFITPYRTSLSENDLNFSQGDFNVDVVIALGVRAQADLDQAITSHGRILHDATVVSITNADGGELGSIHWQDAAASSLSEMVVALGDGLGKDLKDEQIATALLTGIVAETNRFSNEKTTPATMSVSSELMAAGANQQLVATKLQEPPQPPPEPENPEPNAGLDDKRQPPATPTGPPATPPPEPPRPNDGTLEIEHDKEAKADEKQTTDTSEDKNALSQIHVDEHGNLKTLEDQEPLPAQNESPAGDSSRIITEPPVLGGTLTANSTPESLEPTTDALSLPAVNTPLLDHNSGDATVAPTGSTTTPPATADTSNEDTLAEIEKEMNSPHVAEEIAEEAKAEEQAEQVPQTTSTSDGVTADSARTAVDAAIAANPNTQPLQPTEALNAQPVFDDLHPTDSLSTDTAPTVFPPVPAPSEPVPSDEPLDALNMPLPGASFPSNVVPPAPASPTSDTDGQINPSAPPVPPPLPPFQLPPQQ